MQALSSRYVPEGVNATGAGLACGSVVISTGYLKTFVAGFRAFFGGRFRGHETPRQHAWREALPRLKDPDRAGGDMLGIGIRFQSTTIAGRPAPSMDGLALGISLHTAP